MSSALTKPKPKIFLLASSSPFYEKVVFYFENSQEVETLATRSSVCHF